MRVELKHRFELLALSLVASIGAFWCASHHYSFCGHFPHGAPEGIRQWIEDGAWLFALVGTTVLGLRGRFQGARPIGVVAGLIILLMVILREPLHGIDGAVLAFFSLVQAVGLLIDWKMGRIAGEGGASDSSKPPQ